MTHAREQAVGSCGDLATATWHVQATDNVRDYTPSEIMMLLLKPPGTVRTELGLQDHWIITIHEPPAKVRASATAKKFSVMYPCG